MKRVLCVIMIFALLCVMCSSIIAEGNVMTISLESKTGAPGKEVTLAIKVTGNEQGLASTKLKVKFGSALKLTDVKYDVADVAKEQGVGIMTQNEAVGENYYPKETEAIINWVTLKSITGDFTMATLTFKIADDASEGKYDVTFEYDVENIYKIVGESETVNVPFTITGGAIEVKNYIPGDLNGDEVKDSDDAIYLLYHVFYFEEDGSYPVNQNCDFNKDDVVDSDDAIYLLYHVFYFDVDGTYPI